jgi:hypothetical protein
LSSKIKVNEENISKNIYENTINTCNNIISEKIEILKVENKKIIEETSK